MTQTENTALLKIIKGRNGRWSRVTAWNGTGYFIIQSAIIVYTKHPPEWMKKFQECQYTDTVGMKNFVDKDFQTEHSPIESFTLNALRNAKSKMKQSGVEPKRAWVIKLPDAPVGYNEKYVSMAINAIGATRGNAKMFVTNSDNWRRKNLVICNKLDPNFSQFYRQKFFESSEFPFAIVAPLRVTNSADNEDVVLHTMRYDFP